MADEARARKAARKATRKAPHAQLGGGGGNEVGIRFNKIGLATFFHQSNSVVADFITRSAGRVWFPSVWRVGGRSVHRQAGDGARRASGEGRWVRCARGVRLPRGWLTNAGRATAARGATVGQDWVRLGIVVVVGEVRGGWVGARSALIGAKLVPWPARPRISARKLNMAPARALSHSCVERARDTYPLRRRRRPFCYLYTSLVYIVKLLSSLFLVRVSAIRRLRFKTLVRASLLKIMKFDRYTGSKYT